MSNNKNLLNLYVDLIKINTCNLLLSNEMDQQAQNHRQR